MARAILFFVMLASVVFAHRDVWAMTGAQLQGICAQSNKDACTNYIAGVRDAAQQTDADGHPTSLFINPPYAWCYGREEPVTADGEMRAVLGWLREHSNRLSEGAARLVANALADSFKCQSGGDDDGSNADDPFGNFLQ